jgi:hypothetical protein
MECIQLGGNLDGFFYCMNLLLPRSAWLWPRGHIARVLRSAMFRHFMSAVIALLLVLLSGCSNVPHLATTPAEGPTIHTVVNHINCELAFIVNASPDGPIYPETRRIFEYAERSNDPNIWRHLRLLKHYHFVASVLLTLDVSNNEAVSPSLTFIQPLTGTFNRTLSVGGSVTATQERNKSFSYSVDMANVEKGCDLRQPAPTIGITGDFGLADIVIEGLNGLFASESVNVYGSGGPVTPAFDAFASTDLDLTWTCKVPDTPGHDGAPATPGCSSAPSNKKTKMTLKGTVSFSPSSDPETPGTMSFTGGALNGLGKGEYLVSLSGSTITSGMIRSSESKKRTRFLLSGSMTREANSGGPEGLGFAPSVTLVGYVEPGRKPSEYSLSIESGQASPSSETGGKYIYVISAVKIPLTHHQPKSSSNFVAFTAGGGGGASSTTITAKATAPASSNTTQFSSLITFTLALSANGGPNWNLLTFKGPGGGGSSGQLFSGGHTSTDTLSLTFVAACQNPSDRPITVFKTYWDTIPKCNGTQQALASAVGYQNNQLIQAFRGQ